MKSILLSIFMVSVMASCIPEQPGTPVTNTETPQLPDTATPSLDWIQVYFTDPDAPHARDYIGGPDEELAAAITAARLSVDVAAYSLNLWSIRNALLDAKQRGVEVRFVVESDNLDGDEIQDLVATGIPVLGDRREGLMHNKFIIIDRQEVWTGSLNFTVSGGYYDNNNLVRIRSSQVAETYLHEFNEMFMDDRFGTDSLADTLYPFLTIEGVDVEFLFSPDDGVAGRLIELIEAAQESIQFMAFSFTSDEIGSAIVNAAMARGMTVAGVMDEEQVDSNQGTEYDAFVQAGLDVRLDGSEGQMHHKVIIIDHSIVITGSYNFTASAETQNDENLVIIFSPAIAALYLEEFQRVYDQAQQP